MTAENTPEERKPPSADLSDQGDIAADDAGATAAAHRLEEAAKAQDDTPSED